jgi:hypothetical protein
MPLLSPPLLNSCHDRRSLAIALFRFSPRMLVLLVALLRR